MHFFFTDEDYLTDERGSEVRAALVHAGHDVVHGHWNDPFPEATDVWMYGLGVDGAPPLDAAVVSQLLTCPAEVGLFQLCDAESMSFERIPTALAQRSRLFLRNHWPSDPARIPEPFRDRIGWLPPMLKQMAASAGEPLANRSLGSIFFGSRTGFSNIPGDKNAREETVRIMRNSGLPFLGGLLPHAESRYHTDPTLIVPRMRERAHTRHLKDSKICLAPWGNHPLTYRFFEGLALRCLVVAQSLRSTKILDGGLVPGRHYVEVAPDLCDLPDVVSYYLGHLEAAQSIADAGHEHYRHHLESRGKLISSWLFDATVSSWKGLYRSPGKRSPSSMLRSTAARLFPRKF